MELVRTCLHVLAQVHSLHGRNAVVAVLLEAADGHGDVEVGRAVVVDAGGLQNGVLRHRLASETDVGVWHGVHGDGGSGIVEGEHGRIGSRVATSVTGGERDGGAVAVGING